MKVYEAVANDFVKEGTSTIFGLLGDGQIGWWSTMAKYPQVNIIDVHDEGAGLAMAEGWARVTGKIGVSSVTHGPGLTRLTTSLVTATRSHTPIVIYTSTPAEDNDQFINQDRLVSATGAGYIEVLMPSSAESAVRQAFYRAKLESRPIVLSVPYHVQDKECDSDGDDYQASATIFAGQQRIRPDLERLNEAVKIIAESKKPVVILGRGAMESQASQAAERLAKRIGALIATTLIAKRVLGESEYHAGISGLFSTRTVMQLFAEADCVIAVGAGLNTRTIAGNYLYPNARLIHIDIAPHIMIAKDHVADCYIQGDATMTLQEIDDMLAKNGISQTGYRTETVRKALRDADRDPTEFEIETGTVDPREAVRIIDERLPSEVGVVVDTGHCIAFPAMLMNKSRPIHMFVTSFACIGQGLALAIGAAVAVGGKRLLHISGDGSAMQNIQELDTAVRLGLNLLFVILNDEAFGAEYHRLKAKGLDIKLAMNRSPDFSAVGRGFGCRGRVAHTLDEVAAGVDEFLADKGPMILDVRISRNVPSIPSLRVLYGRDV